MKWLTALACACALGATTAAQVVPTGPFVGAQLLDGATDDFESQTLQSFEPCVRERIFQDRADLCAPDDWCGITQGWTFDCSLEERGGEQLFGSAASYAELRFDAPVRRFGGWFAANSGFPNGSVRFYDAQDQLIAIRTYVAPSSCAWTWNGWTAESDPIQRIEIAGNHPTGGYVMLDDLQADFDSGGLVGSPPTLSMTAGGVHTLALDAGSARANLLYLLVGSLSGTTPGFSTAAGVVPLNFDSYTLLSVLQPNAPPLGGSFGSLDANGTATATLTIPAGTFNLIGESAYHAYVLLDVQPGVVNVPLISGPAQVAFVL